MTTVQPHPRHEHQLLTGSYDEHVRLWDRRTWRRPLAELRAPGGVWRARWHPHAADVAVLACMHGGVCTVRYSAAAPAAFALDAHFTGHGSMAYGVDWQPVDAGVAPADTVVASCSFYDRLVRVWRPSDAATDGAVRTAA